MSRDEYSPEPQSLGQLAARSAALARISHRLRTESSSIRAEAALRKQTRLLGSGHGPRGVQVPLFVVLDPERLGVDPHKNIVRLKFRKVIDPVHFNLLRARDWFNPL